MASMTSPTQWFHKAGRAHTDPLWVRNRFLMTGHNTDTPNGTASFIRFRGIVYVVTCGHVALAAKDKEVPSLMVGRGVMNFGVQKAASYEQTFRCVDRALADIAISHLPPDWWSRLIDKKGKANIDLDAWVEPDWGGEHSYIAVGYPTEHKTNRDEKTLSTPMPLCVAELASNISPSNPVFTLHSTLANPHGWYFSGTSGGIVYQSPDERTLLPCGVIFEGGPSSAKAPLGDLVQPDDIFFRAQTLTPSTFESWLKNVDLIK